MRLTRGFRLLERSEDMTCIWAVLSKTRRVTANWKSTWEQYLIVKSVYRMLSFHVSVLIYFGQHPSVMSGMTWVSGYFVAPRAATTL